MDSEKKQLLQDEILQEMRESLKNSNFGKVLEKYGISRDTGLKFQCILDLTKIQLSDTVTDEQVKDFLPVIPVEDILTVEMCCVPCLPLGCCC